MTEWTHEEVITRRGSRSGLPVSVAVHSRKLGPAIGGVRVKTYPHWRDGFADALRLSEAMTLKCAVAGVAFGGGKSVIAVPDGLRFTPARRRAALTDLGELIASLGGSYLPGPDVGTGTKDMVLLNSLAPKVFCLPRTHGGAGSSSRPTAAGVLAALRAGLADVFGSAALTGRTVMIVGLGAVGTHLARDLARAGARVAVSDVDDRKRSIAAKLQLDWVAPDKALAVPVDVLVPAAVGGVFSTSTIPRLAAPLIVGPANNQLTRDGVADELASAGIVWVPDFVASAGGIVYTLAREIDNIEHAAAMRRVRGIGETTGQLLAAARAEQSTPLAQAQLLAARRLTGR